MGYEELPLWNSTPKRIDALLFVARRRQKRNLRERLLIVASAFREKPETLNRYIRDLSRDA